MLFISRTSTAMEHTKKEFELLAKLKGDKVPNALGWIKNCYDCYYKNENGPDSPFAYLRQVIEEEL